MRIHGIVPWHPTDSDEASDELCVHTRVRPYDDTEKPVATVCEAVNCIRLTSAPVSDSLIGRLVAGRWRAVYGTVGAEDAAGASSTADSRHTVEVERVKAYPSTLRDGWDELSEDSGDFGFVDLSAPFAVRSSPHSADNPLPMSAERIDALETSFEIISRSGLFEGNYGGGSRYVAGHGYANSEDVAIVTDMMREWLRTTDVEVVLIPDVQRRVAGTAG